MNIWLALLLGVLVGWLLEWGIDWLYWRRNARRLYTTDAALRQQLAHVQAELAAAKTSQAELTRIQAQLHAANTELASVKQERDAIQGELLALRSELERLRSASSARPATTSAAPADLAEDAAMRRMLESLRFERDALQDELNKVRFAANNTNYLRRDDLEQIEGIGPVFEQRLFAGGVETFAQLAATTPDEIGALVNAEPNQALAIASWIEQAAALAELAQRLSIPERLEEIKGIGPVYGRRLRAANIKSIGELATVTPEQLEEVLGKGRTSDYANWIDQAQAYAVALSSDRTPSELEQIKGIGPALATRLALAGITGLDDLQQLSEPQLKEIIGSAGWRLVNYERWMAQAKQRVRIDGAVSK